MNSTLIIATFVERKHFHIPDFCEKDDIFALVVEGSFTFTREGEEFLVQKHEGALFRKNVFYHREVIEPVKLYLFRYKSESPLFSSDYVRFHDTERVASTIRMLDILRGEIKKNEFECYTHYFNDLVLHYELEHKQVPKTDPVIQNAITQLKQELHSGVDLFRLSEESGYSYIQFLRRFKAYTGMNPSDYVISLRLQRAKTLLSDTDIYIRDIAFRCGFENEYYFSNFFKKHTSYSPSAFRKLSKLK